MTRSFLSLLRFIAWASVVAALLGLCYVAYTAVPPRDTPPPAPPMRYVASPRGGVGIEVYALDVEGGTLYVTSRGGAAFVPTPATKGP
jgi:hypothetical protein